MTKLSINLKPLASFIAVAGVALLFLGASFNTSLVFILSAILLFSLPKSWFSLFFTSLTALIYLVAIKLSLPWPTNWYLATQMAATIFIWTCLLLVVTVITLYLTTRKSDRPPDHPRRREGDTSHQNKPEHKPQSQIN